MSFTFVIDVIRTFLSMIDKMVYWFLDMLISLFDALSNSQLFTTDVIDSFASRLYVFISVIMIFKVSFSIIQYIINPDIFNDNQKGMGKVVQSVLLTLVALVLVPSIFNIAYDVQSKVINENIIPSIILGVDNVQTDEQTEVKNSLPFTILSPFVVPNTEIPGIKYDGEKGVYTANNVEMFKTTPSSKVDVINGTTNVVYTKGNFNEAFANTMRTLSDSSFSQKKYKNAYDNYNYMALLDLINAKSASNPDVYILEYKFIISTIVGGFVVIMYLNFCIDLAIRAAKLGFLQLIAPIPIISMVDPKSAKSGMMSKWVNQSVSAYAGLFLRIAAVNFVIFIVYIVMDPSFLSRVNGIENINGVQSLTDFVKLVMVFGALMFAKELPKLISDLTGVDFKGDFKLNPLKRVPGAEKALGIATAGALGAAGGIAANTLATARNWGQSSGRERFSSLAGILTGGVSAGFRGLTSKEKNPFKAANAGIRGSVAARNLRDDRNAAGNGGLSGFMDRRAGDVSNWAGIESGFDAYDKEISAYKEVENQANDILTRANSEMIKHEYLDFKDDKGNDISMRDFKQTKEELALLRGRDTSRMDETELKLHAQRINDMQTYIAKTEKLAEQSYVDAVMSGKEFNVIDENGKIKQVVINDAATVSKVNGLKNSISTSSYGSINSGSAASGKDIKALKEEMMNRQAEIVNSEAYKQAQVNKRDKGK